MTTWVHPDLQRCMCWDTANNKWCDGYWDQCENYWRSTYVPGGAGAIAAVVLALFVVIYFVRRLLSCLHYVACTLVRGTQADEGLSEKTVRYFRRLISTTLLAAIVCAVFCICYHKGDIRHGINDINDSFTTFRKAMAAAGSTYNNESIAINSLLFNDIEVLYEVSVQAQSIQHWTNRMDDVQSQIMNAAWALDVAVAMPVVFLLLSLSLSHCGVHRVVPEMTVSVFIFFALAICISQTTFGVLSVVTPDVCDDYPRMTGVASQIIHSQLKCDASPEAPLGRVFTTTEGLTSKYINSTCSAVCKWPFACHSVCNSLPAVGTVVYNTSTLQDELDRGTCEGPCTIAECAALCVRGSTAQVMAEKILADLDKVAEWKAAMVSQVYPLAGCEMFVEQIAVQQANFCGTFKHKLRAYTVAMGVMSVLATVTAICTGLLNYVYEKETPGTYTALPTEQPRQNVTTVPIMVSVPHVAYGAAEDVTCCPVYPPPYSAPSVNGTDCDASPAVGQPVDTNDC